MGAWTAKNGRKTIGLGMVCVCMLMAGSAIGATSTDTQFSDIVTQLNSWMQGSLGKVIRAGFLIVGTAIGIKTGKLVVPLWSAMCLYYAPEVVETVFGLVV